MIEETNYLANKLNIKNKELLEKDLLLHNILINLKKNKDFQKNYVFKGGTCLIKCYLGYYRFSEDLDFSYIFPENFNNFSENQIRNKISNIVTDLSKLLLKIAKENKLDFSSDKSNNKYFEFGGNNKFTTFKLWYDSNITKKKQFIKIQINFLEQFNYNFKKNKISNLIENIEHKEFEFLFPNQKNLLEYPKIKTYDIREILIEKYRAILTRKALKSRDFIDIYLILDHLKEDSKKYKNQIIKKTKYVLNKYQKYRENLELRKKLGFNYIIGEEEKLLLKEINMFKLKKSNKEQINFLEEIILKL